MVLFKYRLFVTSKNNRCRYWVMYIKTIEMTRGAEIRMYVCPSFHSSPFPRPQNAVNQKYIKSLIEVTNYTIKFVFGAGITVKASILCLEIVEKWASPCLLIGLMYIFQKLLKICKSNLVKKFYLHANHLKT